jgi:hypothetical protein
MQVPNNFVPIKKSQIFNPKKKIKKQEKNLYLISWHWKKKFQGCNFIEASTWNNKFWWKNWVGSYEVKKLEKRVMET